MELKRKSFAEKQGSCFRLGTLAQRPDVEPGRRARQIKGREKLSHLLCSCCDHEISSCCNKGHAFQFGGTIGLSIERDKPLVVRSSDSASSETSLPLNFGGCRKRKAVMATPVLRRKTPATATSQRWWRDRRHRAPVISRSPPSCGPAATGWLWGLSRTCTSLQWTARLDSIHSDSTTLNRATLLFHSRRPCPSPFDEDAQPLPHRHLQATPCDDASKPWAMSRSIGSP
jgi:hypothetical protein